MERYTRNELIDGIGPEGQQKLKDARVLVVGAGGLGSSVLYYLAAAGVGTIGIIDNDVVDPSNLQRQIVHTTQDIGKSKVDSAAEAIRALNPNIKIETYKELFTIDNGRELIENYHYTVDCCDNYEGKYLINDICVALKKPYTHAAVLSMRGEVMSYVPGHANYRMIFDNPPPEGTYQTSETAGILGAVAGIVGSIQATEVIKFITGVGCMILDRILLIDGRKMEFHSLRINGKEHKK